MVILKGFVCGEVKKEVVILREDGVCLFRLSDVGDILGLKTIIDRVYFCEACLFNYKLCV